MNTDVLLTIVYILAAFSVIARWSYALGQRSVPKSLTAEWHSGYNEGVKAASIGLTRDSRGRFARAKVLP